MALFVICLLLNRVLPGSWPEFCMHCTCTVMRNINSLSTERHHSDDLDWLGLAAECFHTWFIRFVEPKTGLQKQSQGLVVLTTGETSLRLPLFCLWFLLERSRAGSQVSFELNGGWKFGNCMSVYRHAVFLSANISTFFYSEPSLFVQFLVISWSLWNFSLELLECLPQICLDKRKDTIVWGCYSWKLLQPRQCPARAESPLALV